MKWLFYLYSLTRGILLFAVVIAFIHLYIGSIFLVSGASMAPTLESGDILFVNKLAYLTSRPKRGDIVILKYPGDPERRKFVKRVIAVPLERVEIKDGRVYINKKFLTEAYLSFDVISEPDLSLILKPDEYYTVGDNRPNSSDSRIFGPTSVGFLIGAAKLRIWPLDRAGYIPEVFY